MSPYLLWAVGLFMIFLEFYLPGGIMGTIGTIVVLASIVVFALQSQSPLGILLYTIGTVVSVIVLFKFALWKIRHARPERSIYAEGDQEGYSASAYDKSTIGKIGIVHSDLKPGGHILVDGKQHGAISTSGYISKGEQVIVTGGEGESLIVKLYRKEKES
ncbi:MAG: NfeD family protein [Waddliaceae bacterium]